jgi:hypothetical protein
MTTNINPALSVTYSNAAGPTRSTFLKRRCTLLKTVRDAELTLLKKLGKARGGPPPFDPKKPPRASRLRSRRAS